MIRAALVIGFLALPASAEAEATGGEPGEDGHPNLYQCLAAVSEGQEELGACQERAFAQCIGEILEARGNPGIRATSLCWSLEISEWLTLSAGLLEESLWVGEPLADEVRTEEEWQGRDEVLAHFAEMQVQAADRCIRAAHEQEYPLEHIGPCFAEVYGPALLEALKRTYPQ